MGELTTVTTLEDLASQELAAYDVTGKRIAIARVGDAFYAFGDTCEVLRGPAREPVASYPVRLEAGALEVEV